MGKMTCVNGESIVCMDSKGKLMTTDVCMTPPFCVPIPYTNLGESLMADQTCSSITMGGIPVCNQKSTFNITTGDAPGVCAGVASASIGQMAQFKEGSKTVNFCGEPAVCNGKLMTGNMDNTGPQPLQQPPCQNPPAGTAEAPAAMTGEFSQQVNLANIIGYVTGTETLWARPPYEVCDKDGKRIAQGMLDKKGNIERFYTAEKEKVTIWLGDGGWRIFGEHDHDREEAIEADEMDDSGNSTAAASRPAPKKKTEAKPQAMIIYFVDFAMEGIAKLDYKFEVNGKTISGSTDAEGKAETLKDYRYGSVVEVKVLKAHTQDYVSIGEITSVLSETVYNVMSPKIKLEIETEPHKG